MQAAHDFDSFNVDRVLFLEFVLLVSGDKCEVVNVLVKIGQRKFDGSNAAVVEQRQVALFFGLEIVKGDAGKVGNDDVAGNFSVRPSRARS